MILMIRAITSQKESCLSEFLPLADMLTNLEMQEGINQTVKVMKIDRKFKEVMALAMMMALASKKVNKGGLCGDAAIPSRTIFAATSSSQSCDRRDLVNHHLWGVRSDQSEV